MQKLIMTGVLILGIAGAQNLRLNVDVNKSILTWTGRKVAGSHTGILKLREGWIGVREGLPAAGEFRVDMTSLRDLDIESPEWRERLEQHLRSADFFMVDSFPTLRVVITGASRGTGPDAYVVQADLTIKNLTHPVVLQADIKSQGNDYVARGKVMLDRTLWDIRYRSGKFFQNLGDKLIYDEFEVQFEVVAGPGK